MSREEMIDAAFAGEEIGDITEVNHDDDDEEFGRFVNEALSRKPKKLSGAGKKRVKKFWHRYHRSLRQPPVLHPLEAFVLERGK